jgi:hypothetical protein
MIVGISAGREEKVTEKAVKTVLEETEQPNELYSLSSFEILTCDACNGCISTNRCVKDDKLNEIIETMIKADGIVFGAPEYWDGMNAKGRAFWERVAFSLRHNDNYPLADKPGVIVGVSGDGDSKYVLKDIKAFFDDVKINTFSQIEVRGEYACFSCGLGHICRAGGLTNFYKIPVEKNEVIRPELCEQYPETENQEKDVLVELKEAGQLLDSKI